MTQPAKTFLAAFVLFALGVVGIASSFLRSPHKYLPLILGIIVIVGSGLVFVAALRMRRAERGKSTE